MLVIRQGRRDESAGKQWSVFRDRMNSSTGARLNGCQILICQYNCGLIAQVSQMPTTSQSIKDHTSVWSKIGARRCRHCTLATNLCGSVTQFDKMVMASNHAQRAIHHFIRLVEVHRCLFPSVESLVCTSLFDRCHTI